MIIVLGRVSGTPALNMTFVMMFFVHISPTSESPRIISPTYVSRASESLIRLTLDAANQSTLSPTFLKNVYHLISAAEAAEFSAEGADCSSPKLDLRPSIFSKYVDSFIDVFREEPVTCLEDRLERQYFGAPGSL